MFRLWPLVIAGAVAMALGAVPARTQNAYASGELTDTVSVIATASNRVIATIPVGQNAHSLVAAPDNRRVYVLNRGSQKIEADTTKSQCFDSIIDTSSNTVSATISLPGCAPQFLSPNGGRLYLGWQPMMAVLDTASYQITVTNVRIPEFAIMAPAPDFSRIYATRHSFGGGDRSDDLLVISTASNSLVATIPLEVTGQPMSMVATPDGRRVYIAHADTIRGLSYVSVVDAASNRLTDTISVPKYPLPKMVVSPDGSRIYVTNTHSVGDAVPADPGGVSVIATATNRVIATIALDGWPRAAGAISPDGRRFYVPNWEGNSVWVIDTIGNRVARTIPVGTHPRISVISPDGRYVYVAITELFPTGTSPSGRTIYDVKSKGLSVIDTASDTVITTLPVRGVIDEIVFATPPSMPALLKLGLAALLLVLGGAGWAVWRHADKIAELLGV